MNGADVTATLLVVTVASVGILHTLVPDHWGPIVVIARQRGWSILKTARVAATAGLGHVTSTLLLGVILWAIGASFATHYGHLVNVTAAAALVAFGAWIGYAGWRDLHHHPDHEHAHMGHAHVHRHEDSTQHVHWHEHHEHDWHATEGGVAVMHEHDHTIAGRTALLLILGSSPMVEGIPAFLAASTHGATLLVSMAIVFALSTIATYVLVSAGAIAGLQRLSLGPLERYGEVISGTFVALVGIYALATA